jgi:ABC-type phosphate transport system substrate-binding protein
MAASCKQASRSEGERMNRLKMPVIVAALLLLVSSMLSVGQSPGTRNDVAVVVNRDIPVDNLTFAELRKMLLGDRQFWSSNMRVTLLIRAPEAHEREVVLKSILQMSEAQFRQYWIGKVFRAESAAAPKTVYTNEMATSLIGSIPGAMAFIDSGKVPKEVKVLRIDGLLPGEKGYPLN